MNSPSSLALCLMGPTACGKTDLALGLARELEVEIINVDSAQIYQQMDIGTGKPSLAIREQIPHHLMDFLDPKISYNVAQFRNDVLDCMQGIIQRKRTPLLVGGTMLYFHLLQQGLSPVPESSPDIRQMLEEKLQKHGLASLYQSLQTVDLITANRLQPTDSQRIQRALEIYHMTGKPMSYWLSQPKILQAPYRFINIGLLPIESPRSLLHQKISDRFKQMLKQGLVEEVEQLYQRGDLHESLPAIRAVGYRQMWRYLQGQGTFDEMQEKAIAATRQLAKRQLTWLRRWPELIAFDFLDNHLMDKVKQLLAKHHTSG